MTVALAAALPVVAVGCDHTPEVDTAVVSAVIDGDTVILEFADTTERVRLIGIDTPELARDDKPAECGADLATAALSIEPNTALADRIEAAAQDSRTARRGLWGLCPVSDR